MSIAQRTPAEIQQDIIELDFTYRAHVQALKMTPRQDAQRGEWQRFVDSYPAAKKALIEELHAANGRVMR